MFNFRFLIKAEKMDQGLNKIIPPSNGVRGMLNEIASLASPDRNDGSHNLDPSFVLA